MRRRIEPVGEQALDGVAAVLARRQADRVHDDELDRVPGGRSSAVGGQQRSPRTARQHRSHRLQAIPCVVSFSRHSSLMPSRSIR